MAETFRRGVGDQITLGYRQLPSVGSEGPDLKTMVYAGLGIALGILVGTVMADGSWRTMNPLAQHRIVQASSSGSGSADRPAAKAAQAPPLQAQSKPQESPHSSPAPQSPAVLASADRKAPAVHAASVTRNTSGTREASITREAIGARSAPGTRRVSAVHRRRQVHGMASWKRHLGRHRALRRHRLRPPRKSAIAAALFPTGQALKPDDGSTVSAFTVEGELTVSAYNASTGTIETYEGEAFALPGAASAGGGIQGEDLSNNIHYRCDQFGSCTLKAGQFVLKANRTK